MGNNSSFVSGSLVIALASIGCTGIGVLLASCYRMKCSEVNLCGMVFRRDIDGETSMKPTTLYPLRFPIRFRLHRPNHHLVVAR